MAGIADELRNPSDKTGGIQNHVASHLAEMPDDLRKLAEQLLDSSSSDRAVARAFAADGYPLGSDTPVRNYRMAHNLSRFRQDPNR